MPQLIILTGLPGTGKSEIAAALSKFLRAAAFSKDQLEACFVRSGLAGRSGNDRLGYAGYELLEFVADASLGAGSSVILDSVATFQRIRESWEQIASRNNAQTVYIECVCSDIETHKRRLATRLREIDGWPELSWADVQSVNRQYQPVPGERLVLDAVDDLQLNVHRAINYVVGSQEHL